MKMLTTEEAATYLFGSNAKPNTLAQWRYRGEGPKFRKIGALVRYAESDLDEYLRTRTHTGTALDGSKSY